MTKRKTVKEVPAAPRRKTAKVSAATPRRTPRVREVAVPEDEMSVDAAPDQPFEEGAHDMIDADLRHRMISEAAYYRYAQRGYADGYDIDDWAAAEEEIDHLLLNPPAERGPSASN